MDSLAAGLRGRGRGGSRGGTAASARSSAPTSQSQSFAAPATSATAATTGEDASGQRRTHRGGRHHRGEKAEVAAVNGTQETSTMPPSLASSVATLKEMFSDWSTEDLTDAINEAHGDVELAATRISEGAASQWEQQVKVKKAKAPAPSSDRQTSGPRGVERGERSDRGGRSGRGGRGGGAPKTGAGPQRGPRPAANGYSNGTLAYENTSSANATPSAWRDASSSAAATATSAWGASTAATSTNETSATADAWETATDPVSTDPGWGDKAAESASSPPAVQSAKSKGKAPARSFGTAAGGMSWAQIARPQDKTPAPDSTPAVVAPDLTPAEQQPSAPAPAQQGLPPPVVVSIPKSAAPAPTPEPLQGLASNDPWALTPAAASNNSAPADAWSDTPAAAARPSLPSAKSAASPAALAIGEGWAETVLADDHSSFGQTSRQQALANVPPAGMDPAGPLEQSSPIAPKPVKHDVGVGPDPPSGVSTPPGLSKQRPPGGGPGRLQQDQAVVMPQPIGAGATERIGMQFGSLNLFGSNSAAEDAKVDQSQTIHAPKPIQPAGRQDTNAYGHSTPVQQILAPEARVPQSNAFEAPQQPTSAMSHHSAPQQGGNNSNPAAQALPHHLAYGYPQHQQQSYTSAYQDAPSYAAPGYPGQQQTQESQQQHSVAAYFQQHQPAPQSTGSPAQQPQSTASPVQQQQHQSAYQPFAAPGTDYSHMYGQPLQQQSSQQQQAPQQPSADTRQAYAAFYDQFNQSQQQQQAQQPQQPENKSQQQAPPGMVNGGMPYGAYPYAQYAQQYSYPYGYGQPAVNAYAGYGGMQQQPQAAAYYAQQAARGYGAPGQGMSATGGQQQQQQPQQQQRSAMPQPAAYAYQQPGQQPQQQYQQQQQQPQGGQQQQEPQQYKNSW